MWYPHKQKIIKFKDYTKELEKFTGELDDIQTKIFLAKYFKSNLGLSFELLNGGSVQLYELQELILRAMFIRDNGMIVAARGFSKSYLIAFFSIIYPLFVFGSKICLISANFRSSRRILEYCETIINNPRASLLKECFPDRLQRSNDMYRFKIPNPCGSEVFALPLSTGEGLRGTRASVVVVDEASMLDVSLAARLLEAVRTQARVYLVGDVHQLPSVGPGNVLRDLIASGVVPCVELTQIKRQDEGTLIVSNCHRIKDGRDVEVDNRGSRDFFWVEESDEDAAAAVLVDLVSRRLPAHYGIDPVKDLQVVVPLKEKGALSCKALNAKLRAALNPAAVDARRKLAVGDKVIQTRNDYGLDIINGDMGVVAGVDEDEKRYIVRFDAPEREIEIPFSNHNLELAYAITCHKFQGSESRIVVIPVHRAQGQMIMQRNWIYTAISRAREVCVLVGQRGEVPKIVRRQSNLRRWTSLQQVIREGFNP